MPFNLAEYNKDNVLDANKILGDASKHIGIVGKFSSDNNPNVLFNEKPDMCVGSYIKKIEIGGQPFNSLAYCTPTVAYDLIDNANNNITRADMSFLNIDDIKSLLDAFQAGGGPPRRR